MSRPTDNPVEEALHNTLTGDLFAEEINDSLRLLWKKLISIVPAHWTARADEPDLVLADGTGRILMRGPGLNRLDLGTAYEDTVAYRDYAACMAEPEDQIYVPGRRDSASEERIRINEAFLEEMIVSDSGTLSTTSSERIVAPFRPALTIFFDNQYHPTGDDATEDVGPDVVFAFFESAFGEPKDVQGTRLESPMTRPPGGSGPYRGLSFRTRLSIKEAASRILWYGCVMIDMAHPSDRPILGTLWFNSWFVRVRFKGFTVLIESDLEARAGTSCSLQEFLGWFMDGQGFPHSLVSREGATVMYTDLVAIARQSASFTPTPRTKTKDQMDVDSGLAGEAALAHQEDRSATSPRSGTSEFIPRESGRDDEDEPGSQSEQDRGAGDRQQQSLDSACAGELSASFRKQNGSRKCGFSIRERGDLRSESISGEEPTPRVRARLVVFLGHTEQLPCINIADHFCNPNLASLSPTQVWMPWRPGACQVRRYQQSPPPCPLSMLRRWMNLSTTTRRMSSLKETMPENIERFTDQTR